MRAGCIPPCQHQVAKVRRKSFGLSCGDSHRFTFPAFLITILKSDGTPHKWPAYGRATRRRRETASLHKPNGRVYQPGIGPHGEDRAVELAMREMRVATRSGTPPSGKGFSTRTRNSGAISGLVTQSSG